MSEREAHAKTDFSGRANACSCVKLGTRLDGSFAVDIYSVHS